MFAYIYLIGIVKCLFCCLHRCAGSGREHFLQGSGPCFQSLFHGDHGTAILEGSLVGYLTDHSVRDGQLAYLAIRNLANDIAPASGEEVSRIYIVLNLYAQAVTKCHLADSLCHTSTLNRICGNNLSRLHIAVDFLVTIHDLAVNRQVMCIFLDGKENNLAARFLKFRRYHVFGIGNINCKGNQCRRYVDFAVLFIIEAAGHTVLAADGRKSKSELSTVSTEQSGERCAPSLRIFRHTFEVLLEGKADLVEITAVCHDLSNRIQHCVSSAVVRAPAGQVRIIAVAHHGNGIAFALAHRQFCHHRLCLGHLVDTAVWQEYTACAHGAVEHLNQTLLGAYI